MAISASTPAKSKKMTVASVLKRIETEGIRWIDLQFVDVLGALQHITIPSTSLGAEEFKRGVGKLDGSSIKGFKEIHESDMVMDPDPSTFAVLPWYESTHKTARFFVDVYEGGSHERFTRDSRYMAQRAAQFAGDQGYDTTYWGPEIEFFVFDGIRMLPTADAVRNPWSGAGYEIISREAPWQDTNGKNFPIRFKEGYYPAPPVDSLQDYRNEACRVLIDSFGMTLDAHHHEVATAGQCEIDMRYDELVPMADNVVTYRYVMKMVAHKMGMMATFMPKPIFGDNASGMHVHQSLWTKGKNMMYDPNDEYAEISQTCRYYIGGLMEHARSLCAFTCPTTNSYRRLVPGYEAPVFIAWSKRKRSANIRIPMYYKGVEAAKRNEYPTPEPPGQPDPSLPVRVLPVHGRVILLSERLSRPLSEAGPLAVRSIPTGPSSTGEGVDSARQRDGFHPGVLGQLVRPACRISENSDPGGFRPRLGHRRGPQVPAGVRRLALRHDLRHRPRTARLASAVVRLLEPDGERESRVLRDDDRSLRAGRCFRPPPRIHAQSRVHGRDSPESRHLVRAGRVRGTLRSRFHGYRDGDHLRLRVPPPYGHQRHLRPEPMVPRLCDRAALAGVEKDRGDSEREGNGERFVTRSRRLRRWFKSNGVCPAGHHGGAEGRHHGGAPHPEGSRHPRREAPGEDGHLSGGPRPVPLLLPSFRLRGDDWPFSRFLHPLRGSRGRGRFEPRDPDREGRPHDGRLQGPELPRGVRDPRTEPEGPRQDPGSGCPPRPACRTRVRVSSVVVDALGERLQPRDPLVDGRVGAEHPHERSTGERIHDEQALRGRASEGQGPTPVRDFQLFEGRREGERLPHRLRAAVVRFVFAAP